MGYSSSAIDSILFNKIIEVLHTAHGGTSSNGWGPDVNNPDAFAEIGRENDDGAVTGTVWAAIPGKPGSVRKAGGFRLYEGKVVRFPGATKEHRQRAEMLAQAEWSGRQNWLVGSGGFV